MNRHLLATLLVLGVSLGGCGGSGPAAKKPSGLPPTTNEMLSNYQEALKSSDVTTKKLAIVQLGNLGAEAKSALPALNQLLNDSDEGVKQAAKAAIDKIEGKK